MSNTYIRSCTEQAQRVITTYSFRNFKQLPASELKKKTLYVFKHINGVIEHWNERCLKKVCYFDFYNIDIVFYQMNDKKKRNILEENKWESTFPKI